MSGNVIPKKFNNIIKNQRNIVTSHEFKIGARNNASDKQTIQTIHDNACDLGAECKPMDMNEGITAMINGKAVKGMMDLGALEYARQEGWDIVSASQVLAQIAQMCQSEMTELVHLDQLSSIMKDLCAYIVAEVEEMTSAAEQGVTEEANEAPDNDEAGPQITATYEGDVLFKSAEKVPEMSSIGSMIYATYSKSEKDAISSHYKKLPDSDFLVVDDSGQHLQVKENGKPDHRLMGAAWAALHEGYRGNKYEGPDKGKALDKLKALYKAEKMDLPTEGKSLNLSYAKSLGLATLPELAVKFVAKDEIKGYSVLWGNPEKVDLEREYFTKDTNFWNNKPQWLTWDHAQDEEFKADPRIGEIVETGDDEWGKWYVSRLKRAEAYRKYLDRMIADKSIGSSSDSAPQYVRRVKTGKSIWLAEWPLFAVSLTDNPCEPRMIGSIEFLKSLVGELPDTSQWQNYTAISEYMKLKSKIGD